MRALFWIVPRKCDHYWFISTDHVLACFNCPKTKRF